MLDACDRKIIAWSAVANAGISGETVRDSMIAAVERGSNAHARRHRVDWRSENGSAKSPRRPPTSRALSARPCLHTVRSPKSNGISESFSSKPSKACYALASIFWMMLTYPCNVPRLDRDYRESTRLRPEVLIPSAGSPLEGLKPTSQVSDQMG